MPADDYLWNIVKRRCTPLGQPKPAREVITYFYRNAPLDQLDLHHHSVKDAHALTVGLIENAVAAGKTSVTVITGKSGTIRREFPTWAKLHPNVRGTTELNGGGAFTIRLTKR